MIDKEDYRRSKGILLDNGSESILLNTLRVDGKDILVIVAWKNYQESVRESPNG